jgi:hypothetical protein
MSLATLAINSLIFVSWAMMRVSAWVVYHDEVWAQMDREGAMFEHYLAEAFLQADFLITLEVICGAGFLGLLWYVLYYEPRGLVPGRDCH